MDLQRRHSPKCPDRGKGPQYLNCKGRCPLRACGIIDGKRIRVSLKTRDLQRARKRLVELEDRHSGRVRKTLASALEAFHAHHSMNALETQRKYKRVLTHPVEFCDRQSIVYVDQLNADWMDRYALDRNSTGWSRIKEIELLRQFFEFCRDREWTTKNPAKVLRRPIMREANDVIPHTQEEIVKILAACDGIGKTSYERRRAKAMVLLMLFAGLRISDVVTLSREHVHGNRLEKRAVKNHRLIRVELRAEVLEALEVLPAPKAAANGSRLFFASGTSSLRSLVKGAWRTLNAVFERSGVERAHCHRFRHTLASELLGKGGTIEEIADILGDSPATLRRHCAKWTPEYQSRQDALMRKLPGTDLAQAEEHAPKC